MTHAIENLIDKMIPDAAPPMPKKRRRLTVVDEHDHPAQHQAKPTPVNDGVILVCGSMLTPQPIAWLWHNWLAQGKLHIFAGAPGQGKTTIAITMAATVTIGGRWPDGSRCEAGNVLIWSGEDDPADTLLPRLIAAGADRERVFFVDSARVNGEIVPFDPARDMVQLMAAINQIGGVTLLIVDPVVSAVAGDSHKNTEVRRALQPLVDLAAATSAAVLGISHFSKGGQGQDPTQRVVGSVAFSAVARVVLVAAKVKSMEGEDRRILARSKSNIGPDDGGFEYGLEQVEALPGIQASRVAWGKVVEGSARELLTDPDEDGDHEKSASDNAEDFLRELLADCPVSAKQVKADATEAGFAWITVRRAADSLGVERKKGGLHDGWYWRLTEGAQKTSKMLIKNDEHLRTEMSTFGDGESQVLPNLLNQLGQLVHSPDVGQLGQVDGQVAEIEGKPQVDDLGLSGGTIEEF